MPKPHQVRHSQQTEQKESTIQVLSALCNRNFTVVTLINFFIMTTYYMIFITSTFYAQKTFSLNLSDAGLTAGLWSLAVLLEDFLRAIYYHFFTAKNYYLQD